uniref:Uncharacterized protein n=1 Tax=Populus trichocarpa TaxID=3694 RepID=A9PHZ4_POPTR|nr:unknown [Populus trichocarpa]
MNSPVPCNNFRGLIIISVRSTCCSSTKPRYLKEES